MSYCRWSSDDFQCDVYCYESSSGYVTHVAGNKPVFKTELPPRVSVDKNTGAWLARHEKISKMLEEAEAVPIGLPYDGKYFCDRDIDDFLNTLLMLKKAGYNVPDWVIEGVREEAATEAKP